MTDVHSVRYSNIKISLKHTEKFQLCDIITFLLSDNLNVKVCRNNISFLSEYQYTIFESGFINITKIPSFTFIPFSIIKLKHIFHNYPYFGKLLKYQVDNITAHVNIHNPIKLNFFCKINNNTKCIIPTINNYTLQYNPEWFHGAKLKLIGISGVIIIFCSGKINILGCKSQKNILLLLKQFVYCYSIYKAASIPEGGISYNFKYDI